jgi:transposase
MGRFPTAGPLISWAGLCPKNDESPTGQARGLKAHGKRRSTQMCKGAPWLKTTLVQCAWAASRKKARYLQAQFHRLRARRGAKKPIDALAASILTIVYHMLSSGEIYRDLGPNHFDRRAKAKQTSRLVIRLQNLGYAIQISPLTA